MARVSFESLPAYGIVGAPLSGVMVVETEKPLEANRATLSLRGSEITQITARKPQTRVGFGGPRGLNQDQGNQVVVQSAQFLEQAVLPVPLGSIGPGTFRLPFTFSLPPEAPPSLATTALPPKRGRVFQRPDGCYVEYELEGRIDVPWWVDPVDREIVPVFSPRRVLGAVPPVRIPADGSRPSILVDIDQPMIVPGQPVTGSFEVMNTHGKRMRSLVIGLQRYVEFSVQGLPGKAYGPTFSVSLPLDTTDTQRAGRFEIPVPNEPGATGPWQGTLFRTFWNFTVQLDIFLGFGVQFSQPLRPA